LWKLVAEPIEHVLRLNESQVMFLAEQPDHLLLDLLEDAGVGCESVGASNVIQQSAVARERRVPVFQFGECESMTTAALSRVSLGRPMHSDDICPPAVLDVLQVAHEEVGSTGDGRVPGVLTREEL